MTGRLSSNTYGKHSVRVSKVRRPRQAPPAEEHHEFVEASVDVELKGAFDVAFTDGDNRPVIATDTCKNTVYVVAKDHPLDTIESFGLALTEHFIQHYEHVEECKVTIRERVWDRLNDSPHGFVAQGAMTPTAVVELARGAQPTVAAGLTHLLIAKTTESGFVDFHRDEFRTLADTEDRILATELSANWRYETADVDFAANRETIFATLMASFLDHYSRSVQETLYRMGQATLAACSAVSEITLTMPNKHHILANMEPFGRENENEVFVVTDEPFGYITGTVARGQS